MPPPLPERKIKQKTKYKSGNIISLLGNRGWKISGNLPKIPEDSGEGTSLGLILGLMDYQTLTSIISHYLLF